MTEKETPHIGLGWEYLQDGKKVAFWIEDQSGEWEGTFNHKSVTITTRGRTPHWHNPSMTLRPRGLDAAYDWEVWIVIPGDFDKILSAVAAFNAYHEGLAKEGEVVDAEFRRQIMPILELGSETPFVKIGNVEIDGANASFQIVERRGDIRQFGAECGVIISPASAPHWRKIRSFSSILYVGGSEPRDDERIKCSAECLSLAILAVAAHNKHHADLAKEGEVVDAETPKPRKIMPILELGSETTETKCKNCDSLKNTKGLCVGRFSSVDDCNGAYPCGVFGQLKIYSLHEFDTRFFMRHPDCIDAEDRYNLALAVREFGE